MIYTLTIRQMENMLKQVVVRSDDSIINDLIQAAGSQAISTDNLPSSSPLTGALPNSNEPETYSLKVRIGKTVAHEEKKLIAEVLNKTNWNRRKAADMLQISYRSLLYKIKDYQLNSTQ